MHWQDRHSQVPNPGSPYKDSHWEGEEHSQKFSSHKALHEPEQLAVPALKYWESNIQNGLGLTLVTPLQLDDG
jgi:hypothetical protein